MKKIFLYFAAIAGLAACTNDDNIAGEPATVQTAAAKTYQVSIPASFGGGAQTRAVTFDANGTDITTTFKTTDKIYAYNETKTAWSREYSDWVTLTPSANAKQAELNGTLAFAQWNGNTFDAVTPEVGDVIHLFYNISNPDFSPVKSSLFLYYTQTGSASSASAYDYAKTTMKIKSIEGSNITLCQVDDDTNLTASFQNMQSMFRQRLTFTDKDAATVTPTIISLEIKSKNNNLVDRHFPFGNEIESKMKIVISNPEIDDYGDIYLALRFDGSDGTDALTLTATDSEGNKYECTKNAPSGGFQNGKYYHGAMTMAYPSNENMPILTGTENYTVTLKSSSGFQIDNGGNPVSFGISGTCTGYYVMLNNVADDGNTVTISGLDATYDGNMPFIYSAKGLTLVVDGDNTVTCKNKNQAIFVDDDYDLKLSGNGTLTVTAKAADRYGLWGKNYNANGVHPNNTNASNLAASGYTVTRSAMTDNGDDTYTWTYTVAPANN